MIDDTLRVANLETILATKLKATFDKAEYKDIAKLLKLEYINLNVGIKKMNEFFKNDFSTSQILKNLTYFDDGDLHKLTLEDKKVLIDNAVKNTAMQDIKSEIQSKAQESKSQ